jgi:ribonuclease J
MYQMVRPRIAVPVHGEARHLIAHAQLARDCQVPETVVAENGAMVRLAPGPATVIDEVPTGRLAADGNQVLPLGSAPLRDRLRMVYNGSAVATVVLDRHGKLLASPKVTVHGVIEETDDVMLDELSAAVAKAVNDLSVKDRREDEAVREAARVAVRRSLRANFGKRPVTEVHIMRI